MTSRIFQDAAQQWHQMKSDYLSHVDAEYDKALEACSGALVNNLGREQHVDGYNLFTGTQARADRYASEELKEYWETSPRLSVLDYELLWMSGQVEYSHA